MLMGIRDVYGKEQPSESTANSFTGTFSPLRLTELFGKSTHHDKESSIYSSVERFISSESV